MYKAPVVKGWVNFFLIIFFFLFSGNISSLFLFFSLFSPVITQEKYYIIIIIIIINFFMSVRISKQPEPKQLSNLKPELTVIYLSFIPNLVA